MKYFLGACAFFTIACIFAMLTKGLIPDFARGAISATLGANAFWPVFLFLDRKPGIK
jgi:hypothetical protein